MEGWLTDAVWSLVEANGNVTFAWLTREVGVSLRSSVLGLDALQAIAEAMLGPAR